MAKPYKPTHSLSLAVSVPAQLSPKQAAKALSDALAELGITVEPVAPIKVALKPAAAVLPKPKAVRPVRPPLHSRNTRHAGSFPCRREPSGLFAAAVTWPLGVPHKGCGRFFTTEKSRDKHEKGVTWNPAQFPNGCLDRIVPAGLRDTR